MHIHEHLKMYQDVHEPLKLASQADYIQLLVFGDSKVVVFS